MTHATYLLPVGETISASWDKVKGAKSTFWAVVVFSIVIAFGIGILSAIAGNFSLGFGMLISFIGQLVNVLIQVGLLYIGIQRAKNLPITYKQMFYAFELSRAGKVIGVYLLQFLVLLPVVLLFALLPVLILGPAINTVFVSGVNGTNILLTSWTLIGIIIGLYLSIRMILSLGFILDKNVNAWVAIQLSFDATRNNEFRLICLFIFQIIILMLAAIPFGIGLIWALPLVFIVYGMTYNNMLNNLHPSKVIRNSNETPIN
jgi:hypothetical protein